MPPPELTVIEGAHRREENPVTGRWWLAGIVALGVITIVTGVLTTLSAGQVEDEVEAVTGQRNVATIERDAAADQAASLAERVVAACASGGESAAQLVRVGACQQAEQVRAKPIPVPGPIVENVRPPSADELRAIVDAYMAAHPPPKAEAGRSATPDEVAAAVAEHLTSNPPPSGRPPTAEEIADAVASYFAANPPRDGRDGEDGRPGPTGQPGRPPTDEEIAAAVARYLAEHPIDTDMTCPDGSSLESVEFASGELGLGCVTGYAPPDEDPPADEDPPDPPAGRPEPTPEPTTVAPTTPAAPSAEQPPTSENGRG